MSSHLTHDICISTHDNKKCMQAIHILHGWNVPFQWQYAICTVAFQPDFPVNGVRIQSKAKQEGIPVCSLNQVQVMQQGDHLDSLMVQVSPS